MNIQDIGPSCFSFFCSSTPSDPTISTFNTPCDAQDMLPSTKRVFTVSRLANELETVKACPWSSYGIRGGGMACGYWVLTSPLGIVLYCIALYWELTPPLVYQVNPSLTRAQFCLPGPSTDANQSNCDLYIPACKDKGNINVIAPEEKKQIKQIQNVAIKE